MKQIGLLLFLIILSSSSVFGENINVPNDHATIQSAIDVALNGDTIEVAAGTYVENINFYGKQLLLSGETAETTIIDGNWQGKTVQLNGSSTIQNFTITGGDGGRGSGMTITGNDATVKNCIFTDNKGW